MSCSRPKLKVMGLSIEPCSSTICIDLESACLSGQGCGLCIALIRPNHWAASVAQWLEHLGQWLEHLSSKQCVVGSSFFFSEKKELFGLVAFPFFLFIVQEFSCDYSTWSVASLVV